MSWNIFKRIALLEQHVKDLTDFNGDNNRWFLRLEERVLEERVTKLEKANQEKNAQAAREKKNAYYRAYYARKKAEAK